jgi:hypothetical protein
VIADRNPEKLLLEKQADDSDENMVIRAVAQLLPPLGSEEEFTDFARNVLIMEETTRHEIVAQMARPLK